ncbi:hypothetical protein AB6A40_004271 [Gnathostoma spinigerum]|uniref:Uncharacterized protein n=1 Tax=Gnathostoma spinigerum TaxID=75299 RepID=A0ABD6EE61_9BILA
MTCRQSFESLPRWIDDVSKFAAPNVSKVLIATKADLESERVVDSSEAAELARAYGICMFLETSAKSNLNVDLAFFKLACQLKSQYESGVCLETSNNVFRLSAQGVSPISSKWSSCCHFL